MGEAVVDENVSSSTYLYYMMGTLVIMECVFFISLRTVLQSVVNPEGVG